MSVVAVISHCKFHILDRCSLSSGCAVGIGAQAMSGPAVHIHVYTHDVKAGAEEKAGAKTKGLRQPSIPSPPDLLAGYRLPVRPPTPPAPPLRLPPPPMAQPAMVVKPPKFEQHTPRVILPRRAPEVIPWKYGKVPVSVPPRRILTWGTSTHACSHDGTREGGSRQGQN